MAGLGYWALVLTLAVSALAAASATVGARRRSAVLIEGARDGALVAALTATAALAALACLMLSRDWGVRYVYEHVSSSLPAGYTLSALWAGQEGSLLVWLWFVSLLTAAVVLRRRVWNAPWGLYALTAMALTQAFLALVLVLASNPFELLPDVPVEGRGLNPLLQNLWMVIHPPVVFAGYATYTVPFALATGGLVVGQLDKSWLRLVRRWALLAWLFLGAGILMGAWWAYLELGWGGYWGWDPVENTSLIPWLTGTALLHSLMMQQRRGAFQVWNLWLISLTFSLCILATFVTRSGIIQSVHAFGRSPIGTYFLAFIALCLVTWALLLSWRRRLLGGGYEAGILLSREASLLLTNLLLVSAALVVLAGTLFPALLELVRGQQAALNVSFYERAVGPLAQVTILLMGICPWLAWGGGALSRLRNELLPSALAALAVAIALFFLGIREAAALIAFFVCALAGFSLLATFYRDTAERHRRSGEGIPRAFLKLIGGNRRRYGAHLVHLGIVLMAVGVTGSSIYQDEVQVTLARGERIQVQGYTLEYRDLVSQELPDRQRFTAVVDVRRGGRLVGTLRPEQALHWNVKQWVTEVAIRTTLKEDLYLILAGFEQGGLASFRVLINPLVVWLWIGGVLLLLGGVTAWWPAAAEEDPQ